MADPEGSKRVVRTAVATPTNETNDAKKPPMVPSATNGGMVDKMWAVLDRHFNPRENKVQRAVANALLALDEHEFIIGQLTKKVFSVHRQRGYTGFPAERHQIR